MMLDTSLPTSRAGRIESRWYDLAYLFMILSIFCMDDAKS